MTVILTIPCFSTSLLPNQDVNFMGAGASFTGLIPYDFTGAWNSAAHLVG